MNRCLPFLAAAALLAPACGRLDANVPTHPEPLALRTFDVPEGYGPRLAEALNRAFPRQGDSRPAEATVGPDDRLLVVGPAAVLDGVEELVGALEVAPIAAPRNIEMTYWFVRGIPEGTDRDRRLQPIASVIDALDEVDGPQSYALIATKRLTSLDGRRARVGDEQIDIGQICSVVGGDQVVADLEITMDVDMHPDSRVETRLALQPGNAAVLARASARDEAGSLGQIYVVVRPTMP